MTSLSLMHAHIQMISQHTQQGYQLPFKEKELEMENPALTRLR